MITSIDRGTCTGCGSCVKSCTLDVFSLDTDQEDLSPCMAGCPCGVDIRGINSLVRQDRLEEAVALLKENVPFPALTSRLCSHPCEAACLRGASDSVNILGLERFLGDLDLMREEIAVPRRHIAAVAVIGSGLAGLTAAWYLNAMGYAVTVFERRARPGGGLWGLVEHGMPEAVLERQLGKILQAGVSFRLHTEVGMAADLGLDDLARRQFGAFCLAGGQGGPVAWGLNILMDEEGRIIADEDTRATSDRRVFAAGEASGEKRPERIVAQGRFAAMSIDRYLRGADLMSGRLPERKVSAVLPPVLPAVRRTSGGRGTGREAWSQAMQPGEVQVESLRCLTCGAKAFIARTDDCMTCFTCEMRCPAGAVTVHPFKEVLPRSLDRIQADSPSFTEGRY